LIPYGAKVILAYSGGPASTAMVKLLSETLNETKKKANLNFKVKCVYIDLRISSEGECRNDEMRQFCSQVGFDLEIIPASDWLETHSNISFEAFLNISDKSLVIDRETQIIRTILTHYCESLQYDWLMSGQSMFRSAVNALSQVCQGRGADLGSFCTFSDLRQSEKVKIVFPMKEFTSKEVSFFNQFNNLTSFMQRSSETAANFNSSIQRLTENFLLNLQIDFPAAAPNARNSGEKVLPRSLKDTNEQICPLCLMNLDDVSNCSEDDARKAAKFSRQACGLAQTEIENENISFCSFCQIDNFLNTG